MKQCLNCSAMSNDDAERCVDCHVRFDNSKPVAAGTAGPLEVGSGVWLVPTGWVLVVMGVVTTLYGLLASGAPQNSETLNIGLLTDKTNMVIAGGFAFTSGVIFVAMGALITRLVILNAANLAIDRSGS